MQTQIMALLGETQALARLIAENQQSGDAKNAVSGIMGDIRASQGSQNGNSGGMGSGSPLMPRQEGVRSPALQETTQPGAELGPYGGV